MKQNGLGVKMHQQTPSFALKPFVECYWYVHETADESTLRPDKILPNGTINLIFNLSGNLHREYQPEDLSQWSALRDRWISGIRDRFLCVGPTVGTQVVGIRFKPGGLAPFLRMPVSEIRDRTLNPDDLWHGIAELHEQICESTDVAWQFSRLESWLFEQAGCEFVADRRVQSCLSQIECSHGNVSITKLSHKTNISSKQLRRLFESQVGISPKRLSRVLRFQTVVQRLQPIQGKVDWAAIAAQYGYYDQSHLIADFHEFTGLTPNDYMDKKSPILNFIPVDGPMSLFSNTSNTAIATIA